MAKIVLFIDDVKTEFGSLKALYNSLEEHLKKSGEIKKKHTLDEALKEVFGIEGVDGLFEEIGQVTPLYKEVKKFLKEDFGGLVSYVGELKRNEMQEMITMFHENDFTNDLIMMYLMKNYGSDDFSKAISKAIKKGKFSYERKSNEK